MQRHNSSKPHFFDSKAAVQGHDGQICTPGFMRSLSGSSLNRAGLRLEVVLGHNKLNSELGGLNEAQCGPLLCDTQANDIVVDDNIAVDDGLALRESIESISSQTQVVSIQHRSAASNHKGKAKAKGKVKVSNVRPRKGLPSLDNRMGSKGESTSKSAQNRALLRASMAEASLLASIGSGEARGNHILDEAQACLQMGKLLGLEMNGKEAEVLEKIMELEVKDIGRIERAEA
ncbi:hypothetical protein LOK49_LG06G02160 [Camellia lanceoleosa]|uniref:Uncharacterized protein n=1 Tax=Camellia lanceoleosa TaxID=1840588 RepID=A0ACC0HHT8_9ERIC|nr:hypothetical protein LOK49_LG06G02160 [Camellia lanceoleosa]